MSRLMARRGYASLQEAAQWAETWRSTVGVGLAQQSRVGRLYRGVLEIVVSNSVVLQELTFKKGALLRQLKAQSLSLRDIRFRVGDID